MIQKKIKRSNHPEGDVNFISPYIDGDDLESYDSDMDIEDREEEE